MQTIHNRNAKVFKALCDETRLRILEMLLDGEKCACKLLEEIDIKQPSLSYQMKILVESRIVESRQEGKWVHYKISERGSIEAINLLRELTTKTISGEKENCCKQQR